MDVLGFGFFQGFMHYLGVLQWPLVAVFLLFIAWQIRGFAPEERLQTALMFAYFFLVITTFWILKPIKKGLFITYYKGVGGFDLLGWNLDPAQAELVAKVLNMAVAAAAVAVFTLLARSFRRQQLTFILSGFFILCYLVYSFLLDGAGGGTVWTFYLFGDLFSTLMVATFFAFLNDSVDPSSAKRLYGLIGLGGVSGGFFGSAVVGVNVKSLSPALSMWLCLAIAVAIALIAMAAGRVVSRKLAAQETTGKARRRKPPILRPPPPRVSRREIRHGKGRGSPCAHPTCLSVAAIVGLYEMVSTIMDFQFTSTVLHYLEGPQIGEHFPRVFTFTNMVALVVQLFLTSFVMTRFGVGTALLFLPVAALLGSAGFLIAPVLLVGSLLNTTDNGFSYSINQSAKEALYVPTTRDEKYKAKAFIDMFVQRFAKALAVGMSLLITTLFAGFSSIRWLSLVTAAILVLWILAAIYAGRTFRAKEEAA